MSYRYGNVSGTGGWLAFLIATLILGALVGLLGAIMSALAVGRFAAGAQRSFAIALGVLGLTRAALCGTMAAALLFSRARRTPQLVIAGLWIGAIGLTAGDIVASHVTLGASYAALAGATVISAVRGGIYAAIWTAYLLRSQRVANTYGVNPDLVAAFE